MFARLPAAMLFAATIFAAGPAAGADPAPAPALAAVAPGCPLPGHWHVWTPETRLPDPDAVNVLRLGPNGALFWNNQPVDENALNAITVYLLQHPVDAMTIVLDPAGADCAAITKYRKKLEKTGCRSGNCLIGKGPPQPAWLGAPPPPPR